MSAGPFVVFVSGVWDYFYIPCLASFGTGLGCIECRAHGDGGMSAACRVYRIGVLFFCIHKEDIVYVSTAKRKRVVKRKWKRRRDDAGPKRIWLYRTIT